ncbi:MAG: N-acetylmuramoyl-L-alanine amidase [Alphaproteobacteria bacterium]|jgi:N-acetylmuramoyl-L-alanine amidase|nr:N-acetylmuramoyl-L-alanine amidase [Alphaproteobacteria bacterium]
MRIAWRASPNFNARRHRLDMLVLHYTGMKSAEAALSRLADPEASVSAHYVVLEDGLIIQMVDEAHRAWHAGAASWQGDDDLNSRSIGVEIVNGGHDFPLDEGGLSPFRDVQVAAVTSLCQAILTRHAIPQTRIVGHSDIAPERKRDPGEHFPWERLARHGIGLWPEKAPQLTGQALRGRGLVSGESGPAVRRMQDQLAAIGYDLPRSGVFDARTEAVVTAFQRRWRPRQVTGEADLSCLAMIAAVNDAYRAWRG